MGQEEIFVELAMLSPGQCFGEAAPCSTVVPRRESCADACMPGSSSNNARSSSAVADTRSEVLCISRAEVTARLSDPQAYQFLWNVTTAHALKQEVRCLETGNVPSMSQSSMYS